MASLLDVLNAPWAILPDRLIELHAIYTAHAAGERADLAEIEARTGKSLQNTPQGYEVDDGVAVIPLHGMLAKRANLFMSISGGASHQLFARDVAAALADPKVDAILIDADTPGGSADGTQLAAAAVRAARGIKPIATLADGTMASAGVWIGAQSDRVYAIDSGTGVGSIGVVVTHTDVSRRLEQAGVKQTDIVAGKYKRIATSSAPLSEEGRASLQASVDYLYGLFVDAVADARGTTAEQVLERMADGRMFIGQQAVDAGLIDGIASREAVLADLRERAAAQRRTTVPAPRRGTAHASTTPAAKVTMTPEQLEQEHPEVAQQLRAQGQEQERARIQSVRAQSMPGHEALIEQLAFDGKTTGPEAAVAVLSAQRAALARRKEDLAADTPPALPAAHHDGTPDPKPGADKPAAGNARHQAQQLAVRIAEVQKQQASLGRSITAVDAMALIKQEG